jgi:hypothetical protein
MIWPFKKKPTRPWPPVRSDNWPRYVDGRVPIACWTHPSGDERVFLIRRREGTYTTDAEWFSNEEFEMCWIGSGSSSIYDTEETARWELSAQYPWTNDVEAKALDAEQSTGE